MPSSHSRRAVLAAAGGVAAVGGCAGTPEADHSYEELSAEERAVIDELRSAGSISRGIDDLPSLFEDVGTFTVSIDGQVYTVRVERDGMTADYQYQAEPVDPNSVAEGDVIDYESLSTAERDRFDAALAGRQFDERPGELPQYVRYDNTIYEPVLVVADIPERRLTISQGG